jgi:DNA-binding MarR family transcriptional regulator
MVTDLQDTSGNDFKSVEQLATSLQLLIEAHRRYHLHAARTVGIEFAELDALLVIDDTPGITLSALCQRVFLAPSTAIKVFEHLEALGHIKPSMDIAERSMHLSDKGAEAVAAFREAYRYVLSTTGAGDALTSALPQFNRITSALDATARGESTPETC